MWCCISCWHCRYKRSKHVMFQWFNLNEMLCWYSQDSVVCGFYVTLLCWSMSTYIALNESHPFDPLYWQCWHCQYILANNFLNIQQIFNPKEVLVMLQLQSFLTMPSNPICDNNVDTSCKISNAFNAKMYQECEHCWYSSELSKTTNRLKIGWILRKLWAKIYWQCEHCW